jgi:hypothetical protein
LAVDPAQDLLGETVQAAPSRRRHCRINRQKSTPLNAIVWREILGIDPDGRF